MGRAGTESWGGGHTALWAPGPQASATRLKKQTLFGPRSPLRRCWPAAAPPCECSAQGTVLRVLAQHQLYVPMPVCAGTHVYTQEAHSPWWGQVSPEATTVLAHKVFSTPRLSWMGGFVSTCQRESRDQHGHSEMRIP